MFVLPIFASLLLFGCESGISRSEAEDIAAALTRADADAEWYVSSIAARGGKWVVTMRAAGSDCEKKLYYLDKRSGALLETRGGNECS